MSDDSDLLDLAFLRRQTEGDTKLERELLELFVGQCSSLLPTLVQVRDLRARRDAAHSLRGAAGALGARRIAALAAALEDAARVGEAPSSAALEEAIAETGRAIARSRSARAA